MPNWFLELSQGWDIELGSSELRDLGDTYASLTEAWESTSDVARLWLCARFADTHESRRWCLGTAADCAGELLEDRFGDTRDGGVRCSAPALDVFDAVLEPLQRPEAALASELDEVAEAMFHYYEVPRLLLAAYRVNEKIATATANEGARIRRSGREPTADDVEARIGAGVSAQRSRFAASLVKAYLSAQAALSNWRMSRGQPFSRWGTDVVRKRHRCTGDGRAIEPVR